MSLVPKNISFTNMQKCGILQPIGIQISEVKIMFLTIEAQTQFQDTANVGGS